MLDKRSRKVLRYIKKHGQANFSELLELDHNESLVAQMLVMLNAEGYTIQVAKESDGKRQAVYELQGKGFGALEEYRRQAVYAYVPILISLLALVISILSFFRG